LHVLSDAPNVRQATSLRCIETIKVKYIVRIDVVISYVRDESSLLVRARRIFTANNGKDFWSLMISRGHRYCTRTSPVAEVVAVIVTVLVRRRSCCT